MTKSLFTYAILKKPEDETKEDTTLIQAPKTILASSAVEVTLIAARDLSEEDSKKMHLIEVVVRPF